MAGVGFNASQGWSPEVYVKYGIVNRIPCTVAETDGGRTFTNGEVVSIVGNYTITPTLLPISGSCAFGLAVAQNQVDYTNPSNLSVSVMIPTPGAVISVPNSVFGEGNAPTAGAPIFVTAEGKMTSDISSDFRAGAMGADYIYPFAMVIASDQEYTDLVFPIAGTEFPVKNPSISSK